MSEEVIIEIDSQHCIIYNSFIGEQKKPISFIAKFFFSNRQDYFDIAEQNNREKIQSLSEYLTENEILALEFYANEIKRITPSSLPYDYKSYLKIWSVSKEHNEIAKIHFGDPLKDLTI